MSHLNGLENPPNLPTLPSGTFTLYRDDAWTSQSVSYAIGDHTAGARQSISGGPMQDAATRVAYNLPVGVVVTLQDHVTSRGKGQLIGDLSGAGRCVDLVGTGKTEGISLPDCNMNDCVSCFFWRTVALDLGAVVLFEDPEYRGNRSVLFLSEWPSNTIESIVGWYLEDKVSAITWNNLNDRQQVGIFDNPDGSGGSYENVKGWGSLKRIANLSTVGFNDRMSSFNWVGLAPKKEIIAPVDMKLTFGGADSHSLSQTTDYANRTSVNQSFTASFSDTRAQTLTVTTTETMVVGYKLGYTQTWKIGFEGGEVGGSLLLELTQSYTSTETSTTTETKTIQLSFSENVVALPMLVTHATLVARIEKVPPTAFSTLAQRWYDQPVTGAVQDPANNNWWKRTETVTGQVSGGLAGSTKVDVSTSPLP